VPYILLSDIETILENQYSVRYKETLLENMGHITKPQSSIQEQIKQIASQAQTILEEQTLVYKETMQQLQEDYAGQLQTIQDEYEGKLQQLQIVQHTDQLRDMNAQLEHYKGLLQEQQEYTHQSQQKIQELESRQKELQTQNEQLKQEVLASKKALGIELQKEQSRIQTKTEALQKLLIKKQELETNRKDPSQQNYNDMPVPELFKRVHVFMLQNGLKKAPVPAQLLYDEFGKQNIQKLIVKSYLLATGSNLTIGHHKTLKN